MIELIFTIIRRSLENKVTIPISFAPGIILSSNSDTLITIVQRLSFLAMQNNHLPNIPIVYENNDFLIINKPANISFHNRQDELGIHSLLKSELGYNIWPIHRLDNMTSGLLIFAKSQIVAGELGKMFEKKKIDKIYIALSDKKPKKKQGKIIGDMKKSRNGSWKLTQSKENPAKTHFYSYSLISGIRLFWITPTSGKTHQIRVALKSLGAPILGDKRYTGNNADRGYLHAYRLHFIWQNENIEVNCLPDTGEYFLLEEFRQLIQSLSSNHPVLQNE